VVVQHAAIKPGRSSDKYRNKQPPLNMIPKQAPATPSNHLQSINCAQACVRDHAFTRTHARTNTHTHTTQNTQHIKYTAHRHALGGPVHLARWLHALVIELDVMDERTLSWGGIKLAKLQAHMRHEHMHMCTPMRAYLCAHTQVFIHVFESVKARAHAAVHMLCVCASVLHVCVLSTHTGTHAHVGHVAWALSCMDAASTPALPPSCLRDYPGTACRIPQGREGWSPLRRCGRVRQWTCLSPTAAAGPPAGEWLHKYVSQHKAWCSRAQP